MTPSSNDLMRDNQGKKPWLDAGAANQCDFYKDIGNWYPTWGKGGDRGMTVKSVKMWKEGRC